VALTENSAGGVTHRDLAAFVGRGAAWYLDRDPYGAARTTTGAGTRAFADDSTFVPSGYGATGRTRRRNG
jgi:hypothetical protein